MNSPLAAAFVVLVFILPTIILGLILWNRRRNHLTASKEPFTDLPLRPPGESTRLKLEELSDQFDEYNLKNMLVFLCATVVTITLPAGQRPIVGSVLFVTALVCCVIFGRKILRLQRQLWNYRLGFDGERAVGEALNRLLAEGFHVFHDLPFDGFNIDHVIVGEAGVYAVETKARRKPTAVKGLAQATVVCDGRALHFPARPPDTTSLQQAGRNATTLSKWLSSATGDSTPVRAILALPGWWVESKGRGPVTVLNPKRIRDAFAHNSAVPISPDHIRRIVHQLTERCRLAASA